MKKYFLLLISVLFLCSCHREQEQKETPIDIVGEWMLNSYVTKSVSIGNEKIDIYLKFDASSFEIYQLLGNGRYQHYSGSYTITDNILNGKYSDGKGFGSSYSVSIENKKLILTRQPDGKEIQTFTPTTIPETVKNNIY